MPAVPKLSPSAVGWYVGPVGYDVIHELQDIPVSGYTGPKLSPSAVGWQVGSVGYDVIHDLKDISGYDGPHLAPPPGHHLALQVLHRQEVLTLTPSGQQKDISMLKLISWPGLQLTYEKKGSLENIPDIQVSY